MNFERESVKSEVAVQASTPEDVVSAVLMRLVEGQIQDGHRFFWRGIQVKDHCIEWELTDKDRLAEFFQ